MSAVVKELYAGIPAAISSERPAHVLGANPNAFVLSCGGLPSKRQRTLALIVSGLNPPERLDPAGETSLAAILAREEEGNTNGAQNGGDVDVSEETADIFEEDPVPKEEATLPTEEKCGPSSDLSFAEMPTSFHYLDEAKEKPVAKTMKMQGSSGSLSDARNAFPHLGDEFLFYGGEDFNCTRRDSLFGNVPWAEDVAEVVCAAGESDAKSVEAGVLEEWCDGPKTEGSAPPAWSCEDVYGGEQQTDHSYSRRDVGGNMAEARHDLNYLCSALEEFCTVSYVPIVSAETDANGVEMVDIFAPKIRVTQTLLQAAQEVSISKEQQVEDDTQVLVGQSVILRVDPLLDKALVSQSVIPEVEAPLDKPSKGQSFIPEVEPPVDEPSMDQLVIPEAEAPLGKPLIGQSVIPEAEAPLDEPSMGQSVIPEVELPLDEPLMGQSIIPEVEAPLDKPLMGQSVIPQVEAPLDEPSMGQSVIPQVEAPLDEPSMGQSVILEVEAPLDKPSMGQSVIPEVEAPVDKPSMGQSVNPEVEAPVDKPSMGQSVIPEVEACLEKPSMGQSVILEVQATLDKPSKGQLVIPEVEPSMGQSVIPEVEATLYKPSEGQSIIPEVEPSMGQLVIPEVEAPLDETSKGQSVIPEVEATLDEPSMDQSVIPQVEAPLDEPSMGQSVIPEVEAPVDKPSMGQSVIPEVEPLEEKPLMGQSVIPEVEPLEEKPLMGQSVIPEVEAPLDKPSMGQSVIPEVEAPVDKPSMGQSVNPEVEAPVDKPSMGQLVIPEVEARLDKPSMGQSVIPEVEATLDKPSMGQSVIPEVEPSMGQLVIPEVEPSMGQSVIPEVEAPLDETSKGQSVIPEVEATLDEPLMDQSVIPEVEAPLDDPLMGQLVIPEVEPLMGQLVIPEIQPSMGQSVIPEVEAPLDEPSMGQSVIPQVEAPLDKPLMGQSVIPQVEPSMGQSVIPEVEPLMGQLVIPEVDPSMGQLIILDVQPLVDKPLVRQSVIPQVEPLMGQLVILDVQPPVDKPLVSQSVIPEVEPKRSLKGRRTFEIGRHFRGASLRTVPKNVQRSPASRSAADDMENGVMCSSSVQPKRFRVGRAKESAILREMSSLASDRLFEPARNAAPLSNRAGPEKYGNKMVPKTFFSTAAKLRPLWIDANSGGVFEKFTSPSWIYLLESAAISVFGISRKTNFTFGSIAAMAPYNTKTVSTKSPWSVAYGSTWRDMRVRPPCEFPFHVAPLCADLDAVKDGRCAIARHHALGLQTVMALLFPGCWRLLARKRRQPKRFVSVRRLTFLRFDGASKDADPSVQFFTSLHSAFDADLPLWDRLDPRSMPPSEICADSATVTAKQPTPRRGFTLHNRWGIHFCASLPTSPLIRESARTRLRLSPPEFPQRPSDKPDAAIPAFPESDDTPRQEAESEEKKPKRVSQIRIRKTVPKPDPNLTPMGLPRPKRLKKTEFSLEEIYTNKNYKSPPATRSLETIFEEPKERNGSLVSVSHQKRKRVLEFQDFTIPRKRRAATAARGSGRAKAAVAAAGGFTRAQKAALEGRELDGLLIQRLADLETFLAEQDGAAVAADAAGS